MKKVVSGLIVLVLVCNMFTMASLAEVDFSGGLLDGKPFGGTYAMTDNDISTKYSFKKPVRPAYTFDKVVNITGYRVKANTNLTSIDFVIGEDMSRTVSVLPGNYDGEFVSIKINNVKQIVLNASGIFEAWVYEFNVYGTIVEPVPTKVKNVHIKNITSTSALVAWDPNSEEVLKYIIYLDGQKYGETENTEYKIDNLQPNTSYEITVTAVNDVGEGPPSDPCNFTTLDPEQGPGSEPEPDPDPDPEPEPEPEPVLPTQVKNVHIKHITSTSATISWTPNPEAERITKYVIYVNGEKYGETENTEYLIEGLKEGEKYVVTVTAVNDLGEGPASEPVTFTTSKIADISTTIKVQDILSSIAVLFTTLWPLVAFVLALIAIVPITGTLKQIFRRRSNA